MKSLRRLAWSNSLTPWIIASCLIASVAASDTCAPSVWQPGQFQDQPIKRSVAARAGTTTTSASSSSSSSTGSSVVTTTSSPTPVNISPIIANGSTTAGQVNCRYSGNTKGMDINYYTCTALANKFGITADTFFKLNPQVKRDCSNIQINTDYCVSGFIEPVRATAGVCGPANGNATCLGTAFQCCNANTFKCGNTTADCADGTCYEGACAGDSVFTTTGKCGRQNGYKQCAGVWGDCCNADGKCGTGPAFCGYGNCQLGNCTLPASNSSSSVSTKPTTILSTSLSTKPTTSSTTSITKATTTSTTSTTSTTKPTTTSTTVPTSTRPPTTTTTTPPNTVVPGESSLPSCGKTCFDNMLAQYSQLGCNQWDSYCLCNNPDFANGIRDCSNGACGTAVASTVISFRSAYCSTAYATHTATATGFQALPSCGQTCFNNMVGQYSQLGCSSPDSYCLCGKPDFSNGIRDCSNNACGTAAASSVISYGSAYCSTASATHTVSATTTAFSSLPSCGQTCINNMKAQYSQLGCSSPDPPCLCKNANFGYGIRDCANGACGTQVASTVIAYGSAYCSSATASPSPTK